MLVVGISPSTSGDVNVNTLSTFGAHGVRALASGLELLAAASGKYVDFDFIQTNGSFE